MVLAVAAILLHVSTLADEGSRLAQLAYQNPELVVDLGVGLWPQPLPIDADQDGDCDLVVVTNDVPSNGAYYFENIGVDAKHPLFRPGRKIGPGMANVTLSYTNGIPHVLSPGSRYPRFGAGGFGEPEPIPYKQTLEAQRANQWSLADYDGDGLLDLLIGMDDWTEYGWDNAFDAEGRWTNGPLHGYVYWVKNTGSNDKPQYGEAVRISAGGKLLDVYGTPSPNFADWDGDGDLDLVCGEFMDKLSYFENTGTRREPVYAAGRYLQSNGENIQMELEMLQVASVDWDADGDVDLVVGQEDGRVALVENTGVCKEGMPQFLAPRFFQQQADMVKIGALATPFGCDWDGDGLEDLIVGDTAGFISFVKNLDGGDPPKWAAPVRLEADGKTIRIQAGPNGSIQGPCEAKWGYTVTNVADWDHDGKLDIVINSIWGEVLWFRNTGASTSPVLAAAQPITVEWEGNTPKPAWVWWTPKGKQLVTQWRTTPCIIDLNRDGLNDLAMLDQEGYLAYFERKPQDGHLALLPPQRIFKDSKGAPLQLNNGIAGKSGRRKIAFADWDRDGDLDLLVNGKNIDLLLNLGVPGDYMFAGPEALDSRVLAGHSTCPAIVDWDKNGIPDLLIGAEDGFLYYLKNPYAGKVEQTDIR